MKTILFVTDLYYAAKGRIYYLEDLFLTEKLRQTIPLSICHPQDIVNFEDHCDLIMIRNSGPAANFKNAYQSFRKRVVDKKIKTYNALDGKGDMNGKDYLLQLTRGEYQVIATVDSLDALDKLPAAERYVVKPKDGADSIGLEIVARVDLNKKADHADGNSLIQAWIYFEYEVSFYFVDFEFQYAFYAPDKSERWKLAPYTASKQDLEFAQSFIAWNDLAWGIQRVDACRTKDGQLLLVELEDLNPFLSLLDLDEKTQSTFLMALQRSLNRALRS